ncbi:MAG: single-stranded DNA-binding protein [Thermoanaerobacterales bacterium]|nr:single-stranded DNA-binding protein [Bacillota bacterium]MDI6907730.1 single-stranded DNA-binding protein [Thermoanaerobacterales bacterium]
MLNKVILIGRLTRDPELRYTPNGVPVAHFTLAVDRNFADRQGQRQADFIDIVTWQKLAEVCAKNLGKGRLVAVDGRLQIRSYEDNQGVRRKAAEVVADNVKFLDRPREQQAPGGQGPEDGPYGTEIDLSGDDIPF